MTDAKDDLEEDVQVQTQGQNILSVVPSNGITVVTMTDDDRDSDSIDHIHRAGASAPKSSIGTSKSQSLLYQILGETEYIPYQPKRCEGKIRWKMKTFIARNPRLYTLLYLLIYKILFRRCLVIVDIITDIIVCYQLYQSQEIFWFGLSLVSMYSIFKFNLFVFLLEEWSIVWAVFVLLLLSLCTHVYCNTIYCGLECFFTLYFSKINNMVERYKYETSW